MRSTTYSTGFVNVLLFFGENMQKNPTNANILWTTKPIKPQPLGMILEWSPFKIISDIYDLYPRWPKLLKLEIYSNG